MTALAIRVAILDDDLSLRRALARLLVTEGMVVASYATSDQFFDALALARPDCLILDFQMPGGTGLDVLKHLGQLGISIPTILLTAYNYAGCRDDCLNAGASEYLRKPVNAERLIQAITRISEIDTLKRLA